MKVLCIGHITYDITIPIENFIIENTKTRITKQIECGGGPAATAAYLLGKWGINTTFIGMVGNDNYGEFLKKELEMVNVDTKYIETNKNYTTSSSIVLANTKNSSRTILTYHPENIKMKELEENINPDFILIDGEHYEISKKMIKKYPNAISVIDAGRVNEQIIELSKMVNYLICSKRFAETITGIKIDYNNIKTLKEIYLKLKEQFKNNIIITLESFGCLYELNNDIRIMPALKVKAIDTTGAGDIFHGTFVYSLIKQMDLESSLKLCNIAAGLSTTKMGGRNSILNINEIMEVYNEIK